MQIYYSIIIWIFLHPIIIYIVVTLLVIVYRELTSPLLYCMDSMTEASLALKAKISTVEQKVIYCQEQFEAANRDFNEVLNTKAYYEIRGNLAEWQREYEIVQSALKDTNVNLNSEKRMLNILKAKLESGNHSMMGESSSSKRKFDMTTESTTTESSTSKRK